MNSEFIWLIVGEIFVIALVVIVRIIFKIIEKKKVDNILKYIDKKSKDKDVDDKFKECIDIIKSNNVDTKG